MIGWLSRRPKSVGIAALHERSACVTAEHANSAEQPAIDHAHPETTLAECPSSPNCVCSLATDDQHAIEPFTFDGPSEQAWATLQDVVLAEPRTQIVEQTSFYMWAECRTWLCRFCDDVEFLMDPEQQTIAVRSASRWGVSDLNVNRKRIERLRADFQSRLAKRAASSAESVKS